MNRRQILALSALTSFGLKSVSAQDDPNIELAKQWIAMIETQDWSVADTIMSPDYAPLYPTEKTLPGLEAWKQRQASNTSFDVFESVDYVPIALTTNGDLVLMLVEIHGQKFGGGEAVFPLAGALKIADGQIVGGVGMIDEEVFYEQL